MSEVATPSGATPETTETVSATRAAADTGNVSAFLEADRSAREGKAPEKVTRPKTPATPDATRASGRPHAASVAGKDGAPASGPSAADRAADERLTARIREAVDTSTAQLRRDNEDLRRRLESSARPPEPKGPAGEPEPRTPEYKRYLAMSDAPKIEDFDSIAEHNAAMAVFVNDTRHAERVAAERRGTADLERAESDIKRVQTFHGRIEAFKQTDPEFASKLSPEVKALHGFQRLQQVNAERAAQGQAPLNATVDHAIAEEIYDSEIPAQVAAHLSAHPDDLAALRQAKNPEQLIKAFGILEHRLKAGTGAGAVTTPDKPATPAELKDRAAAVVERSVSSASPPAPSLGKPGTGVDPIKKAVDTGDIGMFLELDRQAMAERRGLRR